MSIFVVGATSQIGYFLLARLRQRLQHVLALSRATVAEESSYLHWLQGDIVSVPVMGDLTAIVSFGPMGGLAQWLAKHKVAPAPRLFATSSMSVLTKAGSSVEGENVLARQLAAGEAALKNECDRLGMTWTLLRPTLIYGAGRDKSLTPIAERAVRTRIFPLPSGAGYRQPVHADDLAQVILELLDRNLGGGMILQMGGGERLSAGQMFSRVREVLPVYTLPLHLPGPVLDLFARLLPRLRGPVSRLNTDLVADNEPLMALLGFSPRPFWPEPWMFGVGQNWEESLSASVGERV